MYVIPADALRHHNFRAAEVIVQRLVPFRAKWEGRRVEVGEENRRVAEEARSAKWETEAMC